MPNISSSAATTRLSSATTKPTVAPRLDGTDGSWVHYPTGTQFEVPPFLKGTVPSFLLTQVLPNVVSRDPREAGGTSIYLGNGWVLTARHVLEARFPGKRGYFEGVTVPKEGVTGHQPLHNAPGWSVVRIPPEGNYNLQMPDLQGNGPDWALYKTPLSGPSGAILRAASSLKKGERLWVIGDHSYGSFRVSTGTFKGIKDSTLAGVKNATGEVSAHIESGFSGGGAFDSKGRLVGIIYARAGADFGTNRQERGTYFIPIESIAADIDNERKVQPGVALPRLRLQKVKVEV